MDTDVLIIGGGISGLVTAWWLAQSGVRVEVWEKSTRPGGKIQSHQQDGYLTEQAASMVMNFKPEVDDLLKRSGLDKLKHHRRLDSKSKRYLLRNGDLEALPMTIGGMFKAPVLSTKAKLQLLTEAFVPKYIDETETVAQFIKRRFGHEFLDKAIDPFIAGTLASDPAQANAMSVLPRLTALEKKYGSITAGAILHKLLNRRTARTSETFSFPGGLSTLIKHLLTPENIYFKGGVDVNQIEKQKQGWIAQASSLNGEMSRKARQIVLATPAYVSARLLEGLDDDISQLLRGIDYAPLSVVHMGFDRNQVNHKLDGPGFLVPNRENKHITGNLWISSLFPNRAPEGKTLLSSYVGGARQPHLARLDDARTTDHVLADLDSILGIKSTPEMVRIDHHNRALPLYHGNYLKRIRDIQTMLDTHRGLSIVANYKGGVSVRDRISCAQAQAREILVNLGRADKISQVAGFSLNQADPVENPCQR